MNIDYFIRKQELLLSKLATIYIREVFFNILNSNERLVGLVGARGVGKTTLLFQYIKANTIKALYMTGDDIEFTNSKIYNLVDEFYTLGGRIVVIDEVHKYKNWAQEVKNIYANKINLELDIGVVRETYFVNCFKNIYYSDIGDFIVDNKIFEIGGKNKSFSQVKDLEGSYLAIDIDFTSNDKKIPLWLFSFMKTVEMN